MNQATTNLHNSLIMAWKIINISAHFSPLLLFLSPSSLVKINILNFKSIYFIILNSDAEDFCLEKVWYWILSPWIMYDCVYTESRVSPRKRRYWHSSPVEEKRCRTPGHLWLKSLRFWVVDQKVRRSSPQTATEQLRKPLHSLTSRGAVS